MKRLFVLLATILLTLTASAQKKKDQSTSKTDSIPPAMPKRTGPKKFEDVITDKALTQKGLFTIHKVDVFWPNGILIKRFASHGALNAPWGIAEARPGFCDAQNAILIGNFGDGRINVFHLDGNFQGQLMNQGSPVAIEGLWAINNEIPGISPKQLYFTAGPNEESDGIFGFLIKK